MRIRHFGFLANRYKKENIQKCREILGCAEQTLVTPQKDYQQQLLELTGIDITLCPCCKKGSMVVVEEILAQCKGKPQYMDTS